MKFATILHLHRRTAVVAASEQEVAVLPERFTEADLDRWLTDESATYRAETGRLIRWAHANKLTAVHIATTRWNGPIPATGSPTPLGRRTPPAARR